LRISTSQQRVRLRERKIRWRLYQARRSSERSNTQASPKIGLRKQRLQTHTCLRLCAGNRLLLLQHRNARHLIKDLHLTPSPLRKNQTGIDEFEGKHVWKMK
jgi:hypothetical protein